MGGRTDHRKWCGKGKKLVENGQEYGFIRATTFDTLIGTANLRLMRLRDILKERYDELPTNELIAKVLAVQEQTTLDLAASDQIASAETEPDLQD